MPLSGQGTDGPKQMCEYIAWTTVVMPETWKWEEQFKATATPTQEEKVAGVKRHKGGRPRKEDSKRRKLDIGEKPVRLRVNRKVKTRIPSDIWTQILVNTHPLTLLNARLVNKDFHGLLQYEGIWRECRRNYYGPNVPDPPLDMKEWQYFDLLEGTGCMSCGKHSVRKTYWAFLRRWCIGCFKEKTMRHFSAKHLIGNAWLLDAIPCASIDLWGSYESAGRNKTHLRDSGQPFIYLRDDMTKIVNEYEKTFGSSPESILPIDEQKKAWHEKKVQEFAAQTQQLVKIESWDDARAVGNLVRTARLVPRREDFFKEKAFGLHPPLLSSALKLIPAYQRAIVIARPPTERSWKELLPKLERCRADAEAQDHVNRMAIDLRETQFLPSLSLYRWRINAATTIETFLAEIVDQASGGLKDTDPPRDAQDFVLQSIRNVWTAYHHLPVQQRPKVRDEYRWFHTDGVLRLSLFDAMKCLAQIASAYENCCPGAPGNAARRFRCPGCTGREAQKLWLCDDLFRHVRAVHSHKLTGFRSFQTPEMEPYAWCCIEWSYNLPLLARHHKSTGFWDPNNKNYQQAPRLEEPTPEESSASAVAECSAFTGRFAIQTHEALVPDSPSDNFISNLMFASSLLRSTGLQQNHQSLIALHYALEIYGQSTLTSTPGAPVSDAAPTNPPNFDPAPTIPPFAVLEQLVLALTRAGNFKTLSNLCCKACVQERDTRRNKPRNLPRTFGELVAHFGKCHCKERWAEEMLALPEAGELGVLLRGEGMEEAREVFGRLFAVVGDAEETP